MWINHEETGKTIRKWQRRLRFQNFHHSKKKCDNLIMIWYTDMQIDDDDLFGCDPKM